MSWYAASMGQALLQPLSAIGRPCMSIARSPGKAVGRTRGLRAALRLARSADPMQRLDSAPMHLRGSMNDWGLGPRLVAQGTDYIAELALPAGVHSFKLASEDWSTLDLGAPGPGAIAPGATLPLAFRGSNITLTITEAGTYRFRVTKTADGAVLGVDAVR